MPRSSWAPAPRGAHACAQGWSCCTHTSQSHVFVATHVRFILQFNAPGAPKNGRPPPVTHRGDQIWLRRKPAPYFTANRSLLVRASSPPPPARMGTQQPDPTGAGRTSPPTQPSGAAGTSPRAARTDGLRLPRDAHPEGQAPVFWGSTRFLGHHLHPSFNRDDRG